MSWKFRVERAHTMFVNHFSSPPTMLFKPMPMPAAQFLVRTVIP